MVGGVGPVVVWMPRLECKLCQGTVHMEYQTIKSRQRLWDDLGEEVRALYGLGLSLREIKVQEERQGQAGLGLRSLNQFVHKMGEVAASWQEREWSSSPPVMLLDAIWVKVMKPTGQRQVDKLGRQRPVKEGGRVPVLVALGVWPQEGKKVILDWETGQGSGEDAESWLRLLTRLESHGVNGRNGLRLIVHDGGSGLCVALDEVHFAARQQRCVFHKLRNILDSVLVPEEYNRKEAGQLKKKILKEASTIWQAKQKATAQRRQAKFVERWQKEQPKVTAAIQRDFEDTIAFYDVTKEAKQNGQKWSPTWLRTTSLLERVNRTYRRKLRSAVILHSLVGLGAILTQLAARIDFPGSWPSLINRLVAQVT